MVLPRPARRSPAMFLLVLMVCCAGCATIGRMTLGGTIQKQSQEMAEEIEKSGALVADPRLEAYLDSVGQRLVTQAESAPVAEFHFAVLDAQAPNAFAIPSGHIYISRGLLSLLNREDELAGVLGHEVGHVLEEHSLKQATGSLAFLPIRLVTRIGGGLVGMAAPRAGSVVIASGEVPAALTGASYSRGQEKEADQVGLELAARAGWDPSGLARVMDALGQQQALHGEDPSRVSWLSTHPASADRSEQIRRRVAESFGAAPEPTAEARAAFLAKLEGLVIGSSAREGLFDGRAFLHPMLDFHVRFPEGEGWQLGNSQQAVAAFREEPPAAVILAVAVQGDDPLAVADTFEPQQGKLEGPPRSEQVNGLETAVATISESGGLGREPFRASMRWIAHQGLVYQISSISTPDGFAALSSEFDAVGKSFRTLTPADRERIFEDRLRIEEAREGESLPELLARASSPWKLEEAAAANGVEPEATFHAGDLVKVTRRERFERAD